MLPCILGVHEDNLTLEERINLVSIGNLLQNQKVMKNKTQIEHIC